ncbi:MAG TPA: GAF domain-containing protein [Gemmatimonadales bacterium]|nr:GAF domain-containing protein [Gemmatimonadales bacterium]
MRPRTRTRPADYRRIFESLPLGLMVWHLEDPEDPTTLRLLSMNEAAAQATGVSPRLILGKRMSEAFPEAGPRGIAAELAGVAAAGAARDLGEVAYGDARSSDGIYTVFAFPLADHRVAVAFENVTRRKLAELARDRREGLASLAYRLLETCNASVTATAAYTGCLDAICQYARWPLGHVLLRGANDDALRSARLWCAEDRVRFKAFCQLSESLAFKRGVGLPGRVWESGRPSWIIDVGADDNFPRARLLPDCGLKGACGFPVLCEGDVVGVLEFFSPEARVPDPDLLQLMEAAGRQLGHVVRRHGESAPAAS